MFFKRSCVSALLAGLFTVRAPDEFYDRSTVPYIGHFFLSLRLVGLVKSGTAQ